MKKIIVLGCFCFLLCSCGSKEKNLLEDFKGKQVTCSQMQEILKENENARLVDVRTSEEYESGHIEGAIHIPVDSILRIQEYDAVSQETPIIVYCQSGRRSSIAKDTLIEAGYTYVFDLGSISNCDM